MMQLGLAGVCTLTLAWTGLDCSELFVAVSTFLVRDLSVIGCFQAASRLTATSSLALDFLFLILGVVGARSPTRPAEMTCATFCR